MASCTSPGTKSQAPVQRRMPFTMSKTTASQIFKTTNKSHELGSIFFHIFFSAEMLSYNINNAPPKNCFLSLLKLEPSRLSPRIIDRSADRQTPRREQRRDPSTSSRRTLQQNVFQSRAPSMPRPAGPLSSQSSAVRNGPQSSSDKSVDDVRFLAASRYKRCDHTHDNNNKNGRIVSAFRSAIVSRQHYRSSTFSDQIGYLLLYS